MWCFKCNCNHFSDTCPKDEDSSSNSFLFRDLSLPKYEPPKPDFNIFDILNKKPKYEPPEIDLTPKFNFNIKPLDLDLPKYEPPTIDFTPKINLDIKPFPKYEPPNIDFTPKINLNIKPLDINLPKTNLDSFDFNKRNEEVFFCGEIGCPGHRGGGRCLPRAGPGLRLGPPGGPTW